MKILFFIPEFPPQDSKATRARFALLREYAKNPECEIDVVTSSLDKQYHALKMGENITIHRLSLNVNAKGKYGYTLAAFECAKKLIANCNYDFIHASSEISCAAVAFKIKKKFKIPYLISIANEDALEYDKSFNFAYKLFAPKIQDIWKAADFTLANSKVLRDYALALNPQKEIGVIYDGLEIDEFFPDYSKRNPQQFTIVCACEIIPENGVRFLIQAFKILVGRYSQIRMIIMGEGSEKTSLEELVRGIDVEDKVVFLSENSEQKRLEYYHKADAFALPTMIEEIDPVLLEVLACGLPLVASDTMSMQELITDNKNALIFEKKNASDLAEKIESLILNPTLGTELGKEAMLLAKSLSWKRIADQYLQVYRQIVNLRKIRQ